MKPKSIDDLVVGDEIIITKKCPYCSGDRAGHSAVIRKVKDIYSGRRRWSCEAEPGGEHKYKTNWGVCTKCIRVPGLDELMGNREFIWGVP